MMYGNAFLEHPYQLKVWTNLRLQKALNQSNFFRDFWKRLHFGGKLSCNIPYIRNLLRYSDTSSS